MPEAFERRVSDGLQTVTCDWSCEASPGEPKLTAAIIVESYCQLRPRLDQNDPNNAEARKLTVE